MSEAVTREASIGGFKFYWLPEEEMFPEVGYAVRGLAEWCAYIREGLPPLVEKGVIQHELGHLRFPAASENVIRAYGLVTAPVATAAVIFYLLFNRKQRTGILAMLRGKG